MTATEAHDLSAVVEGARLAGVLPYIVAEYEKQEQAIITRMGNLLTDGKLTPEAAQIGWIELLQARQTKRRLEQKVRVGVAVGERNSGILSGEPPLPR